MEVTKREAEPDLGEEAADQAGPVVHPLVPGLEHGKLVEALLGQVGQRTLQLGISLPPDSAAARTPRAGRPSATSGRRSAAASRG